MYYCISSIKNNNRNEREEEDDDEDKDYNNPLAGKTYGLLLGDILRWCVHATELLVLG